MNKRANSKAFGVSPKAALISTHNQVASVALVRVKLPSLRDFEQTAGHLRGFPRSAQGGFRHEQVPAPVSFNL